MGYLIIERGDGDMPSQRDARRTYIHFMDDPPRLLCDARGRQLYVQGGSYRITQRGIEG